MVEPEVKIDGTTTSDVEWYSAYSQQTGVSSAIADWSEIDSGDTVYGLIDGSFAGDTSYQIVLIGEDDYGGVSEPITQTLSTAFYTIDFQAGGKEIAFGAPANDTLTQTQQQIGLFKCAMDTSFNDMTAQEVDDFVDGLNVSGGGDTVSVQITSFSTGWDTYNSDTIPTIKKWGKVVTLTGSLKNTSVVTLDTTPTTVFTIPQEFRPTTTDRLYSVCQGSGARRYLCTVFPNGNVTFERYTDSTSFSSISVGSWFPFHIVWILG